MVYNKKTISDLKNLDGKRVVLRCDFNVPINKNDGTISDTKRVDSALETIKYLLDKNAKIILLSHLSRIKSLDDIKSNKKSLKVVYEYLKSKLNNVDITFEEDNRLPSLLEKSKNLKNGSIMMLENTRYNDVDSKGEVVKHESKNNPELGKFWASLGDVYVNDAFGTCHRSHASNVGIASNISESAIGFLVQKELENLSKAITNPVHPVVAIFGGAKVSDKVESIRHIGKIADKILIGGGMLFTFWKIQGHEIGKSLFDEAAVDTAKELLNEFKDKLILPVDAVCAESIDSTSANVYEINNMPSNVAGFDIGPKTRKIFEEALSDAKTIVWNGPLGVFENPSFADGTLSICKSLAKASTKNEAFTVIGGGDSAAAAAKSGYDIYISHVSTGGGASLEFFSGKPLPGIVSIQDK